MGVRASLLLKKARRACKKYVTNFLKGIQPDLLLQWHQLMVELGLPAIPGMHHVPWMITSSDKLMPVLEAFRNRQLPWSELVQRNMQSALDFERLYTNLPQNDLKTKKTKQKFKVLLCVYIAL